MTFNPTTKHITIEVYDFVKDVGDKKKPLLALLNDAPNYFYILVDHLKKDGTILYSEAYRQCKLVKVIRDTLDRVCKCSDVSTFQLVIQYETVDYEGGK